MLYTATAVRIIEVVSSKFCIFCLSFPFSLSLSLSIYFRLHNVQSFIYSHCVATPINIFLLHVLHLRDITVALAGLILVLVDVFVAHLHVIGITKYAFNHVF